jgi:hypothetical protein
MKIIITESQYKSLVTSLLDILLGDITIKTVKEKKEHGDKSDHHSVFDEYGDLVMTIWVKGKIRNRGCKKDLTLESSILEQFERYMPYYRHKIFSKVLVEYVYDKFGIKCDCVQYDYGYEDKKHVDDDGGGGGDEYTHTEFKTKKYNVKKKKKIKESANEKSDVENLIYGFLQDDFYPDYNWGPELFDFYREDVEEHGMIPFYINDSEGYVYYNDGTLEIMPWVCKKLDEYFNDSWYSVFKDWFEENSGLNVSRIVDSRNNSVMLGESIDKNKKLINSIVGFDFSDRITQITSSYDVPKVFFDNVIHPRTINQWLNYWGPMYLFELDGTKYLYQDKGNFEYFIDQEGYEYMDDEIHEKIGINLLGLKFSDIINMYFNEEES